MACEIVNEQHPVGGDLEIIERRTTHLGYFIQSLFIADGVSGHHWVQISPMETVRNNG